MKKKIPAWFYLFSINSFVLILGFVLYILISINTLEKTAITQTENNLRTFAHFVENVIQTQLAYQHSTENAYAQNMASIDAFLKKLARENPTFRLSIINWQGTVLADSWGIPREMENHSNRIEIKNALHKTEGTAIRKSSVVQQQLLYYAKKMIFNKEVYVLRLSAPLSSAVFSSKSIKLEYVLSGVVVFLFILVFSFAITKKLLNPLDTLHLIAQQYQQGNFNFSPTIVGAEEFRKLADKMKVMAKTIETNFHKLSIQKEENEALFFHSQEAIVVFDSTLTVLKCNQAAQKLFQITKNQEKGCYLISFLRNTDIIDYLKNIIENFSADVEPLEATMPPTDTNELMHVLVRCSIITTNPNENARYIVGLTDITRLKKLERIRKDFVANVSHELKTPITSIQGFVETLKDGAAQDENTRNHFLSIIDQQSKRLINIIDDLLTISRLEQNQKIEKKIAFSIETIFNTLQPLYQNRASDKKIKLLFSINAKNIKIQGHAGLIEQAISNLIQNAITYCPKKSKIEVLCEQNTEKTLIIVQDTGTGIPEKERNRIFERFYRIDKGRSREMGGTGLGLSITRHIIIIHDGNIYVENRKDGKSGARFVIELPRSNTKI